MRTLFVITLISAFSQTQASEPERNSNSEGCILIPSSKDGFADLFLIDPATGDRKNITRTEREEEIDPAWSPDGKRIAFASRVMGGKLEIFICNADGSNRQRVSAQPEEATVATSPSWSADGKKLAFARSSPTNIHEIHVVVANGEKDEVVQEHASQPAWSPDGRKIAFVKHGPKNDHGQIAVMDPDGTNVKVLVEDFGQGDLCRPAWSPDGKTLCYPGKTEYGWHLFLVPATGGESRQLTHLFGFNFHPVWLSNEQILFTHMINLGAPGGTYASVNRDGTRFDLHPLGRIESPHPLIHPAVWFPVKTENVRAADKSSPVKQANFTIPAAKSSLDVAIKPISVVPPAVPGSIPAMAWSPDGKRFVAVHESGSIMVGDFDGKAIKPVDVLRGHEGAAEAVAIAANESRIYSAGVDKTLRTWDVALKGSSSIEKESARILGLALSEDGKFWRVAISLAI